MDNLKKAIVFMLISTSSFAIMNALVKYLHDFNPYELVFFRSLGTLIITMSMLSYFKINKLGNKHGLLILRGFLGAVSLILFFASLKYLKVGTAVTLRYLSPIFAALFAMLMLKEKIKPVQWLCFAISLVGVALIKGFNDSMPLIGLMLIISSAMVMGFVFVVVYKLGKSEHPLVIVNYFMAIATVLGGLLAISDWKTPIGYEWLILSLLGVVGFLGQYYLTKALQVATTTSIAPLNYLEVIFTVILGMLWFGDVYAFTAIVGMLLVIIGLLCNIYFKSRLKKT